MLRNTYMYALTSMSGPAQTSLISFTVKESY